MYSKTFRLLGILAAAVLASADDPGPVAGITFETDEWTHIYPHPDPDIANAGIGYYNNSFNFLLIPAGPVQTFSATLYAPLPSGTQLDTNPKQDPTARYLVCRPSP